MDINTDIYLQLKLYISLENAASNEYSTTCYERPPLMLAESGRW